jgi:hypothetical protein
MGSYSTRWVRRNGQLVKRQYVTGGVGCHGKGREGQWRAQQLVINTQNVCYTLGTVTNYSYNYCRNNFGIDLRRAPCGRGLLKY